MVDQTRPRSNSLARALLRAHDAVAARVARERCFWCLRPLEAGVCAICDRDTASEPGEWR